MKPFLKETILLFEQEIDIRRSLQSFLSGQDYDVLTAENPARLLQLSREEKFDLLIIEPRYDEDNDFDIIAQLKSIQPDVKIIILTGSPNHNLNKNISLYNGTIVLLTKPLESLSQLTDYIRRLLDKP